MEETNLPPKIRVGRKPDPTKSTPELREYWRRRYYERKAKKAQTITAELQESESN